MLNQDVVREATRLTRAGQLVEATALLQRMLRGDSAPGPTSGSTARTAPARLEPPTIDAKANVVEETGKSAARAGHLHSRTQMVRAARRHGRILRARPARSDQACPAVRVGYRARGHKVHRRHLQQRGGKPDLQAVHPKPLSGTTASPGSHASRLHPVGGGFRGRHPDELPGGRAELLRGLSRTAQGSQPGEVLELVSHGRRAGNFRALVHSRCRPRMVGRQPRRLLRRSARAGRDERNAALLPRAFAQGVRPGGQRRVACVFRQAHILRRDLHGRR